MLPLIYLFLALALYLIIKYVRCPSSVRPEMRGSLKHITKEGKLGVWTPPKGVIQNSLGISYM